VFSTNANLTGMVQWGNQPLHISNIFHKAKIEINEEGTVAAAATGKFHAASILLPGKLISLTFYIYTFT
jgi:serine protease inhibitor